MLKTKDEVRYAYTRATCDSEQHKKCNYYSKYIQMLSLALTDDLPCSDDRTYALQKLFEAKQAILFVITHNRKRKPDEA